MMITRRLMVSIRRKREKKELMIGVLSIGSSIKEEEILEIEMFELSSAMVEVI